MMVYQERSMSDISPCFPYLLIGDSVLTKTWLRNAPYQTRSSSPTLVDIIRAIGCIRA